MGPVAAHAQLDDLVPDRTQQRLWSVERDDRSCVHDADAIAEALRLVEVVRGEQDGHTLARAQPGDGVDELGANARIETDGRLVEKQHLRL